MVAFIREKLDAESSAVDPAIERTSSHLPTGGDGTRRARGAGTSEGLQSADSQDGTGGGELGGCDQDAAFHRKCKPRHSECTTRVVDHFSHRGIGNALMSAYATRAAPVFDAGCRPELVDVTHGRTDFDPDPSFSGFCLLFTYNSKGI
jgi:hypothetical protein